MAFGHAIGATHLGRVDLVDVAVGVALTTAIVAYIVLLNDYFDRDIDGLKRRLFPNAGAKKTIPDRILSATSVLLGGIVAGGLALGLGFGLEDWLGRPFLGEFTLVALVIFAAYSAPPLKLNYRGGGELLEMLGVGFWLPVLHAYLQAGMGVESVLWLPRAWPILIGFSMLALSSALASGLADERSDRRGGKRTFVVRYGNGATRVAIDFLLIGAAITWGVTGFVAEHVPALVGIFGAVCVLWYRRPVRALERDAITNAFDAQRAYKGALHKLIWDSAQWVGGALFLHRVFLA